MNATTDKYTYLSTITDQTLTRTHLQRKDGVLYLAGNVTLESGEVRVAVLFSVDDGETWETELVDLDGEMHDPKLVLVNYDWWIIAHGQNELGIDTVHLARRVVDDKDTPHWDEAWTPLLANQENTARVTDAIVDHENPTVIHLVYETKNARGRYAVRVALLSTVTGELAHDDLVSSTPALDQHNGRLAMINTDTVALVFEQRLTTNNWSIVYTQYTWATWQFLEIKHLSGDVVLDNVHVNCYHPSIAVDSTESVHICWLMTSDGYASAWAVHITVIDTAATVPIIISEQVADDRYPWVIVDDNNDLFVLVNLDHKSVKYLTRKHDEDSWTTITNLANNTWTILNGWCDDSNLYTVVVDDADVVKFLRVDTALAELFIPVNDLHIARIDANEVELRWTKARNAEQVVVQRVAVDEWLIAPTLDSVAADDVSAHVVDLPEDGLYRFRLVYTKLDHTRGVIPLLDNLWTAGNEERDQLVTWTQVPDAKMLALEYTKLTWEDAMEVKSTADSCVLTLTAGEPLFRLSVTGGPREGFSNEVSPLTAEATPDGDVVLQWIIDDAMKSITVEQSIDGQRWFPCITSAPVDVDSRGCIVTNLARVVYWFRLRWTTDEDVELLSNEVTVCNCFRLTEVGGTYVNVGWVDVSSTEPRRVQISSDGGVTWYTVINAVENRTMRVPNLTRVTEYRLRLYYPDRFTGNYSNTITVVTSTAPVDTLKLIDQDNTTATFSAVIEGEYTTATAVVRNLYTDEEMRTTVTTLVDETGLLLFMLEDLPLGEYLGVSLELVGGPMEGRSAEVTLAVDGLGPVNDALTTVDAHTLRVTADAPAGLTADDLPSTVTVLYSDDGVNWQSVTGGELIDGQLVVTINALLQDMVYTARLVITRGANKGTGVVLTAKTDEDVFPAVHGHRLPGERSAAVSDKLVWIVDRDRVYNYNLTNDVQALITDLATGAARVWSSTVVDRAGHAHIAVATGKRVLLLRSTSMATPIEVYADPHGNAQTHVTITVRSDGREVLTWTEHMGTTAWVMHAIVDGDNVSVDVLMAGVEYRDASHVLTHDGYAVSAVTNTGDLMVTSIEPVLDPMSEDFGKNMITWYDAGVDNAVVDDASVDTKLAVDNIGYVHTVYAMTDGNYALGTVVDGEYTQRCTTTGVQWVTPIVVDDVLALMAERDNNVVACRWSTTAERLTDWAVASNMTLDGTPLTLAKGGNKFLSVTTHAGMWVVAETDVHAAVDAEVFNGVRVNDKLMLDLPNARVEAWTIGDPDDNPRVFMKVNNITREVTDRVASTGLPAHTAVHLTALEELPVNQWEENNVPAEALGAVTLDSTVGQRVIDLTTWLACSWNPSEIVNKMNG